MVTAFDIRYTSGYGRAPGLTIPVLDGDGNWIQTYPIEVYNEANQLLGVVENPDELIQLWNADAYNSAIGRIELDVEATKFWFIGNGGRGFILGNSKPIGDFNSDFSNDFLI
ncbi:MAG TPA: hypothetical protein DCQ29_00915 [Chitinophagaceae bacterium]|nr:hypothetical protein [Chitinophagaceae bacterium]